MSSSILAASMKPLALVLVALTTAAFMGCGSSDETATVAGVEVTIPADTGSSMFAVTRALMRQTPYQPWYQRCVVAQAERLLTPAEARRLSKVPRESAERKRREQRLMLEVAPFCEESDRDLLDPDAPPESFDLVRATTSDSMKLFVREEGLGRVVENCISRMVLGTSDAQFIHIMNTDLKSRERRFLHLISPCIN